MIRNYYGVVKKQVLHFAVIFHREIRLDPINSTNLDMAYQFMEDSPSTPPDHI